MTKGTTTEATQLTLDALFSSFSSGSHSGPRPVAVPTPVPVPLAVPVTHATQEQHERLRISAQTTISHAARETVFLTITDNRRTMLSSRWRKGVRLLRLHKMFLQAPAKVLEAVGRYVARADRPAGKLIDQYIAESQAAITPAVAKPIVLDPKGEFYDLAQIAASLSHEYFGGTVNLPIGWGRAAISQPKRRRRRTLRMGIYLLEEKIIRIHPVLDQQWVPKFFVEWVVFHEMLHHVVPIEEKNGRHEYHSKEFQERERTFHRYPEAKKWEQENLSRLIASRGRVSRKNNARE